MGDLKHEISFPGSGLDSDSAQEFFQPGDGKIRRNIYYPPDSNGVIENALGNTLKDHGYSHGATIKTFQVVGYVNDTENRKSYYFIIGDTADQTPRYLNSLVEYSHDDGTFAKVFWDESEMELEAGKYIKDCQFVDGWIYYNGGTHGLKKVNITFGKNFTTYSVWATGTNYSTDDYVRTRDGRVYKATSNMTPSSTDPRSDSSNWAEQTIYTYPCDSSGDLESVSLSLMNVPPTSAITFDYKSDSTVLKNSLRKKVFQFTYRYKFRDHGYSRTAPYSLLAISPDDESIKGEIENEIEANNYLEISFQSGSLGVIEWVELYVREQNTDVWKYTRRFDEGESSYDFYNDKISTVSDQTTVSTLADSVPKLANSLEYITENILTLGGITEGFDNIELDITLTAGVDSVLLATKGAPQDSFAITEEAESGDRWYGKFEVDAADLPAAGELIYIYLLSNDPTYTISVNFVLTVADAVSITTFRDKCISKINASASGNILADLTDPSYSTFNDGDFSVSILIGSGDTSWDSGSYIKSYTATSGTPNKWGGFKTGANHPFAIVYYDKEMRPFTAMAANNTSVYVPTMPEEDAGGDYNNRSNIAWEIAHYAPSEAYYWQWFYAGNGDISNFWQYVLDNAAGATNASGITTLDISPLQDTQSIYPLSNVEPYVFQKGDRVRILTQESTITDTYGVLVAANSDVEIIEDAAGPPETITIPEAVATTYGVGNSSLIEIYRPRTVSDENTIYYAYGPVYNITAGASNRLHGGTSGTQEETQDIVSSGDVGGEINIELTGHGYSTGDKVRVANHLVSVAANGDWTITKQDDNNFTLDGSTYASNGGATGTVRKFAFGVFTRGDVYFISRAFSEALAGASAGASDIDTVYLVETPSYSDFYESNSYDYGKLNVESDLGEVFLNNIRYSNVFLQDSAINGLATFDGLDYISLPDKNGKIHAMRQLGDSLRVYQEGKTSSVWIGRNEYYDTGGASTLATSSSVLGSIRELAEEYGTINPESVTKTDNAIYGFDLLSGVFWRDSVNGLFPISGKARTASGESANYKMFKYFKDKASDLISSGVSNVDIITEWDDFLEVLYVTFRDSIDKDNNDTIAFHEPSNRWISFYDFDWEEGSIIEVSGAEEDIDQEGEWLVGAGQYRISPSLWYSSVDDKVYGVYARRGGVSGSLSDLQTEAVAYTFNHRTGEFSGGYPVGSNCNGIHRGSDGDAVLTDTAKDWITNHFSDAPSTIYNVTDGSSATITSNTGTTITGVLAGGTDNDWDEGDVYKIGDVTDNHAGASTIVADDGYVIVAHESQRQGSGNHNDAIQIKRSDAAYDASSWVNANAATASYYTTVGDDSSIRLGYPSLMKDTSGNLYLLARRYSGGGSWVRLYKSTDHGVTWDAGHYIAYSGSSSLWTYCHFNNDRVEDTLRVTINLSTVAGTDKECFYLKSTDGGITWTDVAGSGSKDVVATTYLTISDLRADNYLVAGSSGSPDDYFIEWGLLNDDLEPHFIVANRVTGTGLTSYYMYHYNSGWVASAATTASANLWNAMLVYHGGDKYSMLVAEVDGTDSVIDRYITTDEGVSWDSGTELVRGESVDVTNTFRNFMPVKNMYDFGKSPLLVTPYSTGSGTVDYQNLYFLRLLPKHTGDFMRHKSDFFSFYNGALYQHNSTSANRATFYGEKHDVIMDFVINNQANVIKVFNSLGIHTTGDWDITDIEIESDKNHPNGMYSKIPQAYFEQREGIHMSDFLRNMKTTSGTASNTELFEGDYLRGRTMYVKMKNTETDEVKVVKIDTDSSTSRL